MTDLIDAPRTDADPSGEAPSAASAPAAQWAPLEPAPRKRRVGLWVGLGVLALAGGGAVAATTLIAPGTTIAGIPVGGLTPAAAADVLESRLTGTEVELTGAGEGQVLTGADLGASLDARALAEQAFSAHPMWHLGSWGAAPIDADIAFDVDTATDALRDAVPASFEAAVDATVVFDEASGSYITTPSEPGTGIDVPSLAAAFRDAVAAGEPSLTFSGDAAEATPKITDDEAASTAETLNAMIAAMGFYVGAERTVPIDPYVANSWIDIVADGDELTIEADVDAIQSTVDALPAVVNRAPVDATSVINSSGEVLREVTAGLTGREVGDLSQAASDFAAQIESGNGIYELDVTEVAFESTTLLRRIDLNLSEQRAYLYENDTLVNSYLVSSGLPATPTPTGNFRVFAHTRIQDMGCFEGAEYCTEDVPWNTWFAPDIAFHGAYWHNNFGNQMSHGCVNMPIDIARFVYEWAPVGTDVSVHW